MTCDVISMLIGIGITSAVLRIYSLKETVEEKKRVVSTALISGMVIFSVVFGLLSTQSEFFSELILGDKSYAHLVWISFITMMVAAGLEVPLTFLRAQNRSFEFVIVNTIRLLIQIGFNIWFIVFLDYGVLGVLYSTLISFVGTSAYLIIVTIRDCGLGFSWTSFKEMAIYGLPLVLHEVSSFVLTFADRYFVNHYGDLRDVGIYSLGYKLGMLISFLLLTPFHQHWAAEMFNIHKRDDRNEVFPNVLVMISAVSIMMIFGISVFAKDVVRVMANPDYLDAWRLVPVISMAYFFNGLAEYTQLGALITKKTHFVAYSTTIAAVINIILNFLLIPKWGIYGAGVSTILSFYGRFIIVYKFSQRIYPVPYRWYRINSMIAFSAALFLITIYIDFDNLIANIGKNAVVSLIYLAITYFYWLNDREREVIKRIIKKPKQAMSFLSES